MIVFLFRPSPQVPEPSLKAARHCFEAAQFNVRIQRQQINAKLVDLTWIFTQSLFMAVNTLLWALSYPIIRKEHPRAEVDKDLEIALEAIHLTSLKWPGVESALELYVTFVEACRKACDGDSEASYGIRSPNQIADGPSSHRKSNTSSAIAAPPVTHAQYNPQIGMTPTSMSPTPIFTDGYGRTREGYQGGSSVSRAPNTIVFGHYSTTAEAPSNDWGKLGLGEHNFDSRFLGEDISIPSFGSDQFRSIGSIFGRNTMLLPLTDACSHQLYDNPVPFSPTAGLNLKQHLELMDELEHSGIDGELHLASSQYEDNARLVT